MLYMWYENLKKSMWFAWENRGGRIGKWHFWCFGSWDFFFFLEEWNNERQWGWSTILGFKRARVFFFMQKELKFSILISIRFNEIWITIPLDGWLGFNFLLKNIFNNNMMQLYCLGLDENKILWIKFHAK